MTNAGMTFPEIATAVNNRVAVRLSSRYRFGISNPTNAGWGQGTQNATLHRHSERSPLRLELVQASRVIATEMYDGDLDDIALERVGARIATHLQETPD